MFPWAVITNYFLLLQKFICLPLQLRQLLFSKRKHIRSPGLGRDGDASLLGQHFGFDEGEQFGEFGATVGGGSLSARSTDGDALAVDASGRGVVHRFDGTREPVEQVLDVAGIAEVVLGREDPKRVSLADGLADAGHGSRFGLLKVLINQRQVTVVEFRHFGTVADDFLGHVGQLAVEGLGPQ